MIVGKVVGGIVGALVTIRYGLGIYAWRVSELLERPKYSVVEKLPGGIEVRLYEATSSPRRDEGDADDSRWASVWRMRRLHLRRQEPRPEASLEEDVPEHEHAPQSHGDVRRANVPFVMSANETVRTLPVPTDVDGASADSHTAAFVRPARTIRTARQGAGAVRGRRHAATRSPARAAEPRAPGHSPKFVEAQQSAVRGEEAHVDRRKTDVRLSFGSARGSAPGLGFRSRAWPRRNATLAVAASRRERGGPPAPLRARSMPSIWSAVRRQLGRRDHGHAE